MSGNYNTPDHAAPVMQMSIVPTDELKELIGFVRSIKPMVITENKLLLTVKETAELLGRTEDYVRRTLTKTVKPVRDGEIRFDKRDLLEYIDRMKR